MNTSGIERKVSEGGRVTAAEALALYQHVPTHVLGQLADDIRRRKHPDPTVTYIIDRNVNYTNVCVAKCNFCAFYRDVGSSDGYVLGFDEIFRKIDETIEVGGVQLLLQGGHNPDLPLTWYEDLFRAVKARYPEFRLHALSPPEDYSYFADVPPDPRRGRRSSDCGRARQYPWRRRGDSCRSCAAFAALL